MFVILLLGKKREVDYISSLCSWYALISELQIKEKPVLKKVESSPEDDTVVVLWPPHVYTDTGYHH